ncbi:MAG: hypothetical protein H7226_10405, partial [Salinibacterium sp.]|nr:hypothetical protein [Salinibacterium sp.]
MFRRLFAPVLAVAVLAGCGSTPPAAEEVPENSSAVDLVNLWRVTGAEGEAVDTWLRLDAGEFQLWRECGMISGSWRATDSLMLASVFGASGSCATGDIPTVDWLEAVAGYTPTDGGWTLVDAAGSPLASLTIDGAPDPIDTAAEFYTQPPEVTDETRAYFAAADALPASLTPPVLPGRWTPDGFTGTTDTFVEFRADGTWEGSDGCNGGAGRWASDADGG